MTDFKQNIIQHLAKKGNYDPDVDDYLIDTLIDNLKMANEAKDNIATNGVIITIHAGNNAQYTKMNPALNAYQMCMRNIHQCSTKLGINRKERILLKIIEEKTVDEFDKDFLKN